MLFIGMPLSILALVGGVLALVFLVIFPSPGPPIASKNLRVGEPFRLEYTSGGDPQRLFVDLDCLGCGQTLLKGTITLTRGDGLPTGTEEIDWNGNGYTVEHTEAGNRETFEGHLMFKIPAQPTGSVVRLEGTLETPSPTLVTVAWPPSGPHDGPMPTAKVLRLWVAR